MHCESLNIFTTMSRRLRLSIFSRKDRISYLPESVLYHILSFLPSKDAVATSVLSKRWKPLWFSQLNLHFEDKHFPDAFAFRQFFYSVMAMRDKTLRILSFHLNCSSHGFHYKNDFYNVVYAAITGGVENLSIDLCHCRIMTLPTMVLTTKTLSVLKLKRVTITLNDDVVVDLPSLKVLHLKSVCFIYYQHIIKLLSGCPILEDLEVMDLTIPLKKYLQSIPYHSSRDVLSLSNLVRANISTSSRIEPDWLHNAHHLRIEASTNYWLDGMFHNLTHMELIFKFSFIPGSWKWSWLTKLLQSFPKLQTLIIDEINIVKIPYDDRRVWREPTTIPKCILSHLTTCTIRNHSRVNGGLQFAKYIMQNSRVLSTMTIQSSEEANSKLQMAMKV